jgi:hypothetical protein
MIGPPDPCPLSLDMPPDTLDGTVQYHVDADAEPGDVLPALAELLIDMHRRRREHDQDQQPQPQD